MSTHLRDEHASDVLLNDDWADGAADLVGIAIPGVELHVTLVHCKSSSSAPRSPRYVADLYELRARITRPAFTGRHASAVSKHQTLGKSVRELASGRRLPHSPSVTNRS